jgi:hypothetical protein
MAASTSDVLLRGPMAALRVASRGFTTRRRRAPCPGAARDEHQASGVLLRPEHQVATFLRDPMASLRARAAFESGSFAR